MNLWSGTQLKKAGPAIAADRRSCCIWGRSPVARNRLEERFRIFMVSPFRFGSTRKSGWAMEMICSADAHLQTAPPLGIRNTMRFAAARSPRRERRISSKEMFRHLCRIVGVILGIFGRMSDQQIVLRLEM